MLFTEEMITKDFKALDRIKLIAPLINLNEGKYHQGKAAVIQYLGLKK
jgi:hypothetical protein